MRESTLFGFTAAELASAIPKMQAFVAQEAAKKHIEARDIVEGAKFVFMGDTRTIVRVGYKYMAIDSEHVCRLGGEGGLTASEFVNDFAVRTHYRKA